jgi:hypothetical protein
MIVETKYNYNDEVWCMYDNVPTKFYIEKIFIKITNKGIDKNIEYLINNAFNTIEIQEEKLFTSKKELIESL